MDSVGTKAQGRPQPVAFDGALAQRLAQLSPDVVYVYDMQAQRNVYANSRLIDILGLTPCAAQALGEALFARLLHPDDHGVQQAAAQRVLHLADGEVAEARYRMCHVDGSWRWLHDRVTVLTRDAEGKVQLILGTARDVTREQAREEELDRRADALERERVRLDQALAAGGLALWEWNLDDGSVTWDERCWTMFGLPRAAQPDLDRFYAGIDPADLADAQVALQAARDAGRASYHNVYRYRRPDGARRWLACDNRIVSDAQGRARRVIGITRDVTEDFERREALAQSERRFRLAVDAARMVVFTHDRALRYSWIHHPSWPDAAQVLGRDDLELCEDPQEGRALMALKRRAMEERRRVTAEVSITVDARTRWWSLTVEPVFDAALEPDGVLGAAIEITQAREAQALLAASEARYRGIAESVPQLLWSSDARGVPDDFNDRWAQYSGVTAAQCRDDGWRALLHPDDAPVLQEAWRRAVAQRAPLEVRHRLRGADGTYRWFLSRAVPEFAATGRITRWYGSSTDLHEIEELGRRISASEEHFRALAESLQLLLWETDAQGEPVYYNGAWCRYTGVALAAGQQGGWQQALHPDDVVRAQAFWREALATGASVTAETRLRSAETGAYRWFRHRVTPLRGAGDVLTGWVGTSDDIHEEKLLAEALTENEARLRLTMESLGIGTFTLDAASGAVWADDAAAQMHGFDGEYTFRNVATANRNVHPDDRASLEQDLAQSVAQAGPIAHEYRVIDPVDGRTRWIATRGTRLAQEGRYVGIVQDVTALRVAAAERDTSLALLRALVENAPAGVAIVDREFRQLMVNQTVAALTGRTPAECMGRTVREMIGDAAWSALEPYYRRVIDGNETISNVEVNLHDHLGAQRTLLVNYFPIRDGARTIGMAIIGSDITERKQAERELLAAKAAAEQANVAKDRFLAALSHELRTPLSPIELSAHILETNPDDPALVRNRAAVIRRNVATEVRLIDDLLDVTRIAAGKLQLQLQSLDLHELLVQAVETCEPAADAKQVRLSLQLRAGRHRVQGDAARLQQVFWNLLSNAIKFSPGAAPVEVDSVERDGVIVVRVRDHGIGIAAEHLPRLFDPFEQGASDVNRRYGGLGLGLSITQGLVRAHGGSVEAASDGPGQGATFTVRLPLQDVAAAGIEPGAPAQPAASAAVPAVGHVLLIEDHPDTLETMRWLLTNDGWRVSVATTAREARAAVAREPVDLIISDLGLPDADGLELMPQLQAQRQVPAIALTGFGSEVDQKKTLAAGFALHLTKPVDLELLTTSMRALARLPDSMSVP